MSKTNLILGDCIAAMKEMADDSVDSIVTDPPYGLSFMGKRWDYDVPSEDIWRECLRVLKPGGHLLAFAGTRTQHRMAVRIEDAGFEIRDMIAWVYGSGFPKSHNVSKAIDKAAGAEREVVGSKLGLPGYHLNGHDGGVAFLPSSTYETRLKSSQITAPATDAAAEWQGWGTALKPALEPITMARKPLGEKTVAENVLRHGTGAINVDGCRVGSDGGTRGCDAGPSNGILGNGLNGSFGVPVAGLGRWPANFIYDGSDEVVGLFPVTGASRAASRGLRHSGRHGGLADIGSNIKEGTNTVRGQNDNGGSAARFFYCAKASKADREEGLEGMEARAKVVHVPQSEGRTNHQQHAAGGHVAMPSRNHHPTVKPTALMRYLCRLVTPPSGIVLDPFMGSGSTGKACAYEGFNFVGIDMQKDYFEIAKARINAAIKNAKRSGNTYQHNDRISSVLSDTSSNLPSARNSCNASAKPTDQRNLYLGKSSARLFNTPGFRQMELF